MASALVNNGSSSSAVAAAPESFFLDRSAPALGRLAPSHARISTSRREKLAADDAVTPKPPRRPGIGAEGSNPEGSGGDLADFEFRLDDPVAMLTTADELFSDGKLLPMHLAAVRTSSAAPADGAAAAAAARCRRAEIEASVYSPKAPSCSSRWRELLGLRRRCQISSSAPDLQNASSPPPPLKVSGYIHLKKFVHRRPRFSSPSSSIGLPLLRDSDSDTGSISSSRMSLSSSSTSSGHDHDDFPRLSLDLERAAPPSISLGRNPPRLRLPTAPMRRASAAAAAKAPRESPRMSASGRVVFHGLDRSSSSPGSFHCGENHHHRPSTDRSNVVVHVSPVLNVPVCSLRRSFSKASSSSPHSAFGIGQLFSPQKTRERDGSNLSAAAAAAAR